MRNAFADEITKLAGSDERIVLLSGDIGNRLFNTYKEQAPDRFFNCGVAEANMISVAAGMGLAGMRPVAYTITTFITARCYEQIKLDVCYHNSPVIIVGVGAGLSYASLGPTHHSFDDIGLLRLLPNMTIVCPADAWEVRAALRAAQGHDGPVYLRLGKKGEPSVHENVPDFEIGKAIEVRQGTDVCLLATGNIVPTALDAAELLAGEGVSVRVLSFHTVKPLDTECLQQAFADYGRVVTLEEHTLVGGVGSAVSEWAVDAGADASRLLRLGMRDAFLHEAGGQAYARAHHGISAADAATKIRAAL